jgi:hypothetical protein
VQKWLALGVFAVIEMHHTRTAPVVLLFDFEGMHRVGHKAVKQQPVTR